MKVLHLLCLLRLNSFSLAAHTGAYSTDESQYETLQKMSFDLGYGPETFDAYVQPNITVFSNGAIEKQVKTYHNGHAVKFHNMSPDSVLLVWSGNGKEVKMGLCKPFGVSGTASFPGHHFFFAHEDYVEGSGEGILRRFDIDSQGSMVNNYYYDPFYVEGDKETTNRKLMKLSYRDLQRYNIMDRNRKFSDEYKKFTGREYLSMYPRDKPRHFYWPADYFGQEHWVTSKETQFESIPPPKEIRSIGERGKRRVLDNDSVSIGTMKKKLINFVIICVHFLFTIAVLSVL